MKSYPLTYVEGSISVEKPLEIGLTKGVVGIQIASDGRIWICIDGEALIRFKSDPFTKKLKSELVYAQNAKKDVFVQRQTNQTLLVKFGKISSFETLQDKKGNKYSYNSDLSLFSKTHMVFSII